MARKKNKGYGLFAGFMRMFRNHFAADPMGKVKETGLTGEVIGRVGDKLLEKPIQKGAYALAGISYDPRKDDARKGSFLYTVWHFVLSKGANIIIGIMAAALLISFLKADALSQIKLVAFLLPLVFVYIKIKTWINALKKKTEKKNKKHWR